MTQRALDNASRFFVRLRDGQQILHSGVESWRTYRGRLYLYWGEDCPSDAILAVYNLDQLAGFGWATLEEEK